MALMGSSITLNAQTAKPLADTTKLNEVMVQENRLQLPFRNKIETSGSLTGKRSRAYRLDQLVNCSAM